MNKKYLLFIFLFMNIFVIPIFADEVEVGEQNSVEGNNKAKQDKIKKITIKEIRYLSDEVLKEKIALTYLDFKAGDKLTKNKLETLIKFAKRRFQYYGVFYNVNIFYRESKEDPEKVIVIIELKDGFRDIFGGGSYFGFWGRNNWLHRGDLIYFEAGINRNLIATHHNHPSGRLYIEQVTGITFDIDTPYFPFFPLYGDENYYIKKIFTKGDFGVKLHPDIVFGLSTGINNYFRIDIKNLENFNTTNYNYSYLNSYIIGDIFFKYDGRFLQKDYYFGMAFELIGGIRYGLYTNSVYFPVKGIFSFYFTPNEYVKFLSNNTIYSLFYQVPEYELINLNRGYQRGEILKNYTGNFSVITNNDFFVKFYDFKLKFSSLTVGVNFLYDGTFISNYESLNINYYYNTVGGGIWFRIGLPVNLLLNLNAGYTIFNSFNITFRIKFGEL